jgi:Ca2+-binding RTX toxin-like protein
MVSTVTIQGSTNKIISIGFGSTSNFALAEEIAAQINTGIKAGTIVTEYDTGGPPPTLPSGVSGALVQTEAPFVVLPPGYTTDLVTKKGSAVVFGSGAPGETILSNYRTGLTFLAAAGSGTVVAGGGDNRLSAGGGGSWSLYTGGGNDIIAALGGVSATIGAGGGKNAILLGYGKDVVISTGDDSITGGSGAETVDATGAISDFVQGNGSRLFFIGGTGGTTIFGGTGSDTYLGSAGGSPTVGGGGTGGGHHHHRHSDHDSRHGDDDDKGHRHGHSGDHGGSGSSGLVGPQLIVGGSAGNNFLFAGDGLATLVGGGNDDQLFAYGTAKQLLIAASGNETLSAALSSGADTLAAGSGKDLLIGGTGADTFVGGSGFATVMAGSGSQVFEFINHEAGGTELVQGIFDPSSIKIDLVGYGHSEVSHALASQTVTNGSVTIGLTDGTKVTFENVTSLSKSNFV